MTQQEILKILRQITIQLNEDHPGLEYLITPEADGGADGAIQQVLYSAIKGVGGQDCASCSLSVHSRATGTTETFNVEVFQDKFGTDVRLAGFLPEFRQIKSMKELVVLDHQSSPSRLVLVQDDCDEESPEVDGGIAVAGLGSLVMSPDITILTTVKYEADSANAFFSFWAVAPKPSRHHSPWVTISRSRKLDSAVTNLELGAWFPICLPYFITTPF